MSGGLSMWTRVRNFFSPPRETYESRKTRTRTREPGHGPGSPVHEATDRRRHGGTMEIGGH
ncbi:hypothetical protein [Microbacterium atlanticum]|uniref:hypothetical protein n=1 Tax=Microbacterium atlanticum TaxID=2782168 RepID=UPI00188920A3|nr:hypothetical protein [Microbacterium atlanticum]